MLSADPAILGLDGRHLQNWLALAVPPTLRAERPGVVLLVLDDGRPLHALRLGQGALEVGEIPFEGTDRSALERTRKAVAAELLVVLERRALAELSQRVESELSLQADYAAQSVVLWRALRAMHKQGIWSDPPLLELIPPLRSEALQKTFDLLVPDGSSLVAYVIDDDRRSVHASVLALKEAGDLTVVAMHPMIADRITENELARDWRERYRRVNAAVTERLGQPSLAVFLERSTVRKLLVGPPDTLSREWSAGNLVIDPAPTWLLGLIGGAAVAAVATRGAKSLARFLPDSARKMATDLAGVAQDRLKGSGVDPFALLGFDPIELLGRLRSYYR